MRTLTPLILLITALVGAAAHAQSDNSDPDTKTVNLQPQWSAGQSARYKFWSRRKQNATVRFGGKSREVNSTMVTNGEMTWTVDEVNSDGSATATLVMDWITMDVSSHGKTQKNDSRQGEGQTPPLHELLTALTGVPITCQVAADGSIESIEGQAKIKAKLPKELTALAPEKRDLVESASELATLPYAPAKIQPGETYDADYQWSHELGTMNQDWTYTLESVQPMAGIPVATVTGKGELDLDVDRSEMPDNAPPIDVTMREGSAKNEVLFDLDRHEAVGRNQREKQTLTINVTLPKGGGQINRRMEQTIQSQVLRISEQ